MVRGELNLPAGGSRTAKKTQGSSCSLSCQRAPSIVSGDLALLSATLYKCHRGTTCALSPLHPPKFLHRSGGSSAEPAWLGGCEMRPRLCCCRPVLMLLM